jgi:SNF2 family DNA or RNA helicase
MVAPRQRRLMNATAPYIQEPMKPWPFQETAIRRGVSSNLLVNFACGLGKTLVGIEVAKEVRRLTGNNRTLVVLSPKVSLQQWVRNIRRQDPDANIEVWSSQTQYADISMDGPLWVVTNMEMLPKLTVLRNYKWATIVTDEIHKFRNKDLSRTEALKKLNVYRKLGLSATLIERSAADLWSPLNWVAPKTFTSYWRWFDKYVLTEEGYGGYRQVVGTKPDMVDELGREISPFIYRRTKQEVAPYMPPLVETDVFLDLYPQQKRLDDRIRKHKDIEFDLGGDEPILLESGMAKFILRHQLASDPTLLGLEMPSVKEDWVRAYIENNPGEQMLLFTKYRETAIRYAKMFDTALVVGGARPHLLDEFISGKVRILTGTIQAMGTALDLPMARTAIFVSSDWSTVAMDQAKDRIHRLNITEPKNVIYLHATRSVDRKVKKALVNKWSEARLINSLLEEDDDDD